MSNEMEDLRTIISGAPQKITVKDSRGREHELCPLNLADLVEYEDETGASLLSEKREFKLKDLAFLVYLSVRKEGLGEDKIAKRDFVHTKLAVFSMFDLKLLANANEIITDLLRISGLIVPKSEEEEKRPLENQTVEAQTKA
jgi:hypothetical protein